MSKGKPTLIFYVNAFTNSCFALANASDNETYPLLDAIAAPTLVIQARQDQIFPIVESQAIAERIPNAQMVLVEDSGHMLPLEQPQAITALFRLWIESTFLF